MTPERLAQIKSRLNAATTYEGAWAQVAGELFLELIRVTAARDYHASARRAASAWKALAKKYRTEVELWKSVADEGADEEAWLERTLDAVREHCKARIEVTRDSVRQGMCAVPFDNTTVLVAGAHGHALKSVLAVLDAAEKTRGR